MDTADLKDGNKGPSSTCKLTASNISICNRRSRFWRLDVTD
ncbi:hypothetical protein COLAER_01396 [Collinsella aerofaciens ATCC 25986]|uniref:Uncharacterized protein n=1 Tax=Collinsella aerofaciens (strain ATCC 25986 / DSM 3979 / JCM 10188 / KCTC 3647 / NCTC 11838 / VPI 1003) TaxID=411903 RepID=A4EAD8_COLAA|nr:hypothetical protein COLAER_01396 [Collinsella aerofaciens ATCC 25986]